MTSEPELQELRDHGGLLWENSRYDATYAVDREHLSAMIESGAIPVVHLGQAEAVQAVTAGFADVAWLIVYLWCPRDAAIRRITGRATGDTDARIQAWDQTTPLTSSDLTINTAASAPEHAASQIHAEQVKLRDGGRR
jgi:guanylate kinase